MTLTAKNLAKLLREAREAGSMTQEQLAKKAGLKPCAISFFETGTRAPTVKNLVKLANALNVSADYLLGELPW